MKGSRGQTNKIGEFDGIMQSTPISSKKNTQKDEKNEGEDEPLKKLPASNPPEKVVIHGGYPEQTITIRGNLTDECRSGLIVILRKHFDAFAYTLTYMIKIPCSIAEHELKTYPHIDPRGQRKRSIAPDRRKVVKDEVTEWLKSKIVRKDLYLLPDIDWKIKCLMGFKYKCFLEAYKGYHQIQMEKKDEEMLTFHTSEGVFCYTKMPFGLNNAEETYQRLVDTIFEGKIGRNLEVYVDDMVIKSKTELETCQKCSFRMEEGKFLGYILTSEGIIANPEKTKAVMNMPSPNNLKQIYTLKVYNKKDFHWTTEAKEAFQAMKKLIAELPALTAPKKEEELMVYLSVANEAVSAVLLVERDGRQIPIYYVSRMLQGAKINYPSMEKLALMLAHAARRLRRYF
ncbi:reverse transcriptase domain-containing protein [Tanacetum coccineum]